MGWSCWGACSGVPPPLALPVRLFPILLRSDEFVVLGSQPAGVVVRSFSPRQLLLSIPRELLPGELLLGLQLGNPLALAAPHGFELRAGDGLVLEGVALQLLLLLAGGLFLLALDDGALLLLEPAPAAPWRLWG